MAATEERWIERAWINKLLVREQCSEPIRVPFKARIVALRSAPCKRNEYMSKALIVDTENSIVVYFSKECIRDFFNKNKQMGYLDLRGANITVREHKIQPVVYCKKGSSKFELHIEDFDCAGGKNENDNMKILPNVNLIKAVRDRALMAWRVRRFWNLRITTRSRSPMQEQYCSLIQDPEKEELGEISEWRPDFVPEKSASMQSQKDSNEAALNTEEFRKESLSDARRKKLQSYHTSDQIAVDNNSPKSSKDFVETTPSANEPDETNETAQPDGTRFITDNKLDNNVHFDEDSKQRNQSEEGKEIAIDLELNITTSVGRGNPLSKHLGKLEGLVKTITSDQPDLDCHFIEESQGFAINKDKVNKLISIHQYNTLSVEELNTDTCLNNDELNMGVKNDSESANNEQSQTTLQHLECRNSQDDNSIHSKVTNQLNTLSDQKDSTLPSATKLIRNPIVNPDSCVLDTDNDNLQQANCVEIDAGKYDFQEEETNAGCTTKTRKDGPSVTKSTMSQDEDRTICIDIQNTQNASQLSKFLLDSQAHQIKSGSVDSEFSDSEKNWLESTISEHSHSQQSSTNFPIDSDTNHIVVNTGLQIQDVKVDNDEPVVKCSQGTESLSQLADKLLCSQTQYSMEQPEEPQTLITEKIANTEDSKAFSEQTVGSEEVALSSIIHSNSKVLNVHVTTDEMERQSASRSSQNTTYELKGVVYPPIQSKDSEACSENGLEERKSTMPCAKHVSSNKQLINMIRKKHDVRKSPSFQVSSKVTFWHKRKDNMEMPNAKRTRIVCDNMSVSPASKEIVSSKSLGNMEEKTQSSSHVTATEHLECDTQSQESEYFSAYEELSQANKPEMTDENQQHKSNNIQVRAETIRSQNELLLTERQQHGVSENFKPCPDHQTKELKKDGWPALRLRDSICKYWLSGTKREQPIDFSVFVKFHPKRC